MEFQQTLGLTIKSQPHETKMLRIRRGHSSFGQKRGGSVLVEFALVAPLLIILSMVMIQFGIILNAKISLAHVARQVSRYTAVHGTETSIDSTIKTYAVSTAAGLGLTIATTDVTIGPPVQNTASIKTNRAQYSTLPVSITCNLSNRYFLPTKFFGIPITRSTATETVTVMLE